MSPSQNLPVKYAVDRDRILLPLNASRWGRAKMFRPRNGEYRSRHAQPLSLKARFAFYAAATAFGCWLAFGVAWKGF